MANLDRIGLGLRYGLWLRYPSIASMSSLLERFARVSPDQPCPACGKPDFCLVSLDGSECLCTRVASEDQWGEAGYLHDVTDPVPPQPAPPHPPLSAEIVRYYADRNHRVLSNAGLLWLANKLGVTAYALDAMHVGWASTQRAYSFPQQDGAGDVIGIRYRNAAGDKWSLAGGRNGLFVPELDINPNKALLLPEGPSDTMAAIDMGFQAVGRPNNTAGAAYLCTLLENFTRPPIIVADNDIPGIDGAQRLAKKLPLGAKIIAPLTAPDLRAYYNGGGSTQALHAAVVGKANHHFSVEVIT